MKYLEAIQNCCIFDNFINTTIRNKSKHAYFKKISKKVNDIGEISPTVCNKSHNSVL